MASRRRRRRFEAKRPKSPIARATAIIGICVILFFLLFLTLSIQGVPGAAKWMGCFGVVFLITGLVSFSYSIKIFRDTGFDTVNRWAGMLLPLAGAVLWIWVYLVGIFFG
ncbi:MAG: hypothetical protein K5853_06230 [Lachnospiraceae bacterium]|nr:hypothetical protein [Lachnospiraceae bacterium]